LLANCGDGRLNVMKRPLFLLLASLAPWLCFAAESIPTLPLASAAPDFNLPGVDGRNWALKDFAEAKVLVVVFTCNHCPTAQYYEERLKAIVTDYKSKGVALVAIMPNDPKSIRLDELAWTDLSDSFAEMKIRAKDRGFNFPYLYDGDTEAVARAYGPVATPHVFVFDRARKLRYAGAIDDSERVEKVTKRYLREAIDGLLADKEPPVTQTKVVGCSTKWAGKEAAAKAFLDRLAAEPVSLTNADAAMLAAFRKNDSGKLRLVNFWATWCPPCLVEFDELITINRMYRKRDFELVFVSVNQPDEARQVLRFLTEHQASNRNLIFGAAGQAFGPEDRDKLINAFNPDWRGEVPYTVLIDPDGKVIYTETDTIDVLAIKRAIVKALNERKPW
jgi:thiol-disulfide isomerase/thioredoxin